MDERNLERADEQYEMTVTSVGEGELRLLAEPIRGDDLVVGVTFPVPSDHVIDLMSEGETVLVEGGTCDSGTNSGYIRITDLTGELVWEGGSPYCEWPADRYFRMEPIPGAEVCRWVERLPWPPPECCCLTRMDWQILLAVDDPPVPMAPGESSIVTIGERRYFAASQGGYYQLDGPCTSDYTAVLGSAFLVRLAD